MLKQMIRASIGLALITAGCAEAPRYGAVTANLVWEGQTEGIRKQGLRAFAPPAEVNCLIISAHAPPTATSTQTAATSSVTIGRMLDRTILSAMAPDGNDEFAPLARGGGTWVLDRVDVGNDRTLLARAYRGNCTSTGRGELAFEAVRTKIRVDPPPTVTALGDVVLSRIPTVRVSRLDLTPPSSPQNLRATADAGGGQVTVSWGPDADLAGYVVALTSSAAGGRRTPVIERSAEITVDGMVGAARVAAVLTAADGRTSLDLSDLPDNVEQRIFVYAFDADDAGAPLNYSPAAVIAATPRDSTNPGALGSLSIESSMDVTMATISFVSPGEDGMNGTVAGYDLRVSTSSAGLDTDAGFDAARMVMPPMPADPGDTVTFMRSYMDLGIERTDPFFLAARALDGSRNRGPIAVTAYTLPGDIMPAIASIAPDAVLAGSMVTITGAQFGAATGTIAVTADANVMPRTIELPVISWSNTTVVAMVPTNARSGMLTLSRRVGGQRVQAYLPVLRRIEGQLDPVPPPFEIKGAPTPESNVISALYSARPVGQGFESRVVRITDLQAGASFAPINTMGSIAAVSGSYNTTLDRFLFVAASTTEQTLTAAALPSAGTPTNPRFTVNLPAGVRTDGADGLSVHALDAQPNSGIPAVLAFSRMGSLQVGYVADITSGAFGPLTTVTATGASLAALGRRRMGASFQYGLAYRLGDPASAVLELQTSFGTGAGPVGFTSTSTARPPVGERIIVLDVPPVNEFVIIYEERVAPGRFDVRLLRRDQFGQGPGYAPFPARNDSRRLQDAGLVTRRLTRGGMTVTETWIALVTTTPDGGSTLNYVEIDPMSLVANGRGAVTGANLDTQATVPRMPAPSARLSCKPAPTITCPIAWLGPTQPSTLFVRQ